MHRKRFISIFSFISFLLVVGLFIGAKKIDGTGRPINYRYSNLRSPFDNKTYPVKIPDSLDFSGESVPLYDFDVVERLDKELIVNTYWQSRTLLILKEMKQIGSILRPILKSNGLPDDFIYLAVAESGLQNDVVSPSGATGVWQFVANTGRNYGLQIDDYVDERLNYEKATAAACKYLKESKARFGSWTLAAASYNLGQEGLDRSIKNQKVRSYYDLYLNNETSRYIFRILALKEVMKNPQLYGFHVSTTDLYPTLKYHTVTVDSTINNLTEFAVSQGTTYKYLKVFNPWMIYTFIAYGILVIGIHFYIMKTLGKRIFKKHQGRVAPMDIEITKDDIRFSAGDKTALVKWSEFEKAALSDEVVLLYISKLSFYIFPKENFKDNEFNLFSEFVKERMNVAK